LLDAEAPGGDVDFTRHARRRRRRRGRQRGPVRIASEVMPPPASAPSASMAIPGARFSAGVRRCTTRRWLRVRALCRGRLGPQSLLFLIDHRHIGREPLLRRFVEYTFEARALFPSPGLPRLGATGRSQSASHLSSPEARLDSRSVKVPLPMMKIFPRFAKSPGTCLRAPRRDAHTVRRR
jgi:hypothetical protein